MPSKKRFWGTHADKKPPKTIAPPTTSQGLNLLKVELPWIPISLSGNYLKWKNTQTGATRKTYISQGELAGIRADLAKFNKLRLGLGYPWQPISYDGTYITYKSSVSGLTTQAFVPPELRGMAAEFLKASGAPGKVRIIDMTQTGQAKFEYIEPGNFSTLRDISTAEDIARSPWMSHPYTIRQGTVSQVIDGHTLVVDGVVVSIRNTDTPIYKQDKAGWQAAKNYTTNLLLGKLVTLKILTDMPRDSSGVTVADVTVASEDVAGKIMQQGLAPIKSAVPQPTSEPPFGGWDWLNSYQYGYQAATIDLMWYLKTGQWGTAKMEGRYIAGDIFAKAYKEFVIARRKANPPSPYKSMLDEEQQKHDDLALFMLTVGGNIASDVLMIPGIGEKLIGEPAKYFLKPSYLKAMDWLNSFERPAKIVSPYDRLTALWRKSVTLPKPSFYVTTGLGEGWNAMLGGLRDPEYLVQTRKIQQISGTAERLVDSVGKPMFVSAIEGGEKVVFTDAKGNAHTVAEMKFYYDYYHFERLGQMHAGDTAGKTIGYLDQAFGPLQKIASQKMAIWRFSSFMDWMAKGHDADEAFAHSTHYLIDYNPKSLTAFEQTYLYPNIPFYMFARQNAVLQLTEFVAQPQTYAMTHKFLEPFQPTPEEYARLKDYQKGMILVRNPASPESFIRVRLPWENLDTLATSISSGDKAVLLQYPWISALFELPADRNFFDNTKPSKDYGRYFEKKIASSYYYTARDFSTMPLPQFILKQFGIDFVTPAPDEKDVSTLVQDAGYAKTQEQMQFLATQRQIEYENKRQAFVQNLVGTQAQLPVALRDRPNKFNWFSFDALQAHEYAYTAGAIDLMSYLKSWERAQEINYGVYKQTGSWGTAPAYMGNLTMEDKISPGDIFLKLYNEKLYAGRMRMREQWGAPGQTLDDFAGFLIKLIPDITGDITLTIGWGKEVGVKTLQYGGRFIELSSKGEQLYNALRVSKGEFDALRLTSYAVRDDITLTVSRGLHIIGTGYEVPGSVQLGDAVGKYAISPVTHTLKALGDGVFTKGADLVRILRSPIGVVNKPDLSVLDDMLRDVQSNMKANLRAAKDDVWNLQQKASELFGQGYQELITKLVESPSLREQYPDLKPIVERIIGRNNEMAMAEKLHGLLDSMRSNYILHQMMPDAIDAMKRGELKLPDPKETISSSEARNMINYLGQIINPYNFERMYPQTIEEINKFSMEKNGFAVFFEDAFGIQRAREEMHAASMTVAQIIEKVKSEYGIPLEQKAYGYGISKIEALKDVRLPKDIINWLETQDIIRAQKPELLQYGWKEWQYYAIGTVKTYDTVQKLYKIGVTFASPLSWMGGNMQSGLWVDFKYAKMMNINPYLSAWTELARASEFRKKFFKMAEEGVIFRNAYGEEVTGQELIDMAKKQGTRVLGSVGRTDIGSFEYGLQKTLPGQVMGGLRSIYGTFENLVRFPMFVDQWMKGRSVEEATAIITHYHGDYSAAGHSAFENQVMRRLLDFYVWDKFAPTLLIKEALVNPSSVTIPYHIMTAWNGQQDTPYFTDRQMVQMIFKIPGTDAFTQPAVLSLSNSAFKYLYMISGTERGFYWSELQKDPDLLKRFIKGDIDSYVLNKGSGVVKVDGNRATITYAETGDHISAMLNSTTNKLVFVDDQTGQVLKEYPIHIEDGRIGIYKELSPIDRLERVMGEIGAHTATIPIELALNKDFKFGDPLQDNRLLWLSNQFVGPGSVEGRALKELWNPVIPVWEKVLDLALGWYVSHLSHNQNIPWQDKTLDPVRKVVEFEVWKIERGDYLGCGGD